MMMTNKKAALAEATKNNTYSAPLYHVDVLKKIGGNFS